MTTETDSPVYTTATHAAWSEILRRRLSGRLDRALVLRDRSGGYHALGPRRTAADAEDLDDFPLARPYPGLFGGYDAAFHVHLGERSALRYLGVPTMYGLESLELHVLWWVHDPVQVVRTRTQQGWPTVRRSLDRHLRELEDELTGKGQSFGAPEVMRYLSGPQLLQESGLVYRVTDAGGREAEGELRLGPSGDTAMPFSWAVGRREEYAFCREAVRDGPLALASLWLLRHPDEVSKVLDWSVQNQKLLRGETTWQDQLAGLLGTLTEPERTELSALLRDRLLSLGRPVPGPRLPGEHDGRAEHSGTGHRAERGVQRDFDGAY
ncbi:hypothetical protein SLNWT_3881 [Streptomyces albus]|uniref:Uncharacterized protein n=1 Tax=Streptomyces albus (strain ATCC 21838 / DSM 41398 / FERM P-419 / JCM 4703 / NBRC 107858) TaxID=1081613 RepID=A0A0B5F1Q1_STRA4|nr:hypothetical protein SLNWT_3881 [Streptomyces albus]AOU78564.1 hypothetical protein SLNHY_3873 [Streptomyces albus]AYN34308.1 hypothetical protein DUI70_3808 [Streptomyces albus]